MFRFSLCVRTAPGPLIYSIPGEGDNVAGFETIDTQRLHIKSQLIRIAGGMFYN